MPFGLRNAPATFPRLVAKLLKNMDDYAAAYLDDILIFSDSWEDHLKHIRNVLTRIREAGLTLNSNKCVFGVAEVDYLGHHIGLGKIQPRENKVVALLNYPRPTNKKQLQSFLGLAGFYRKYIPHYSHITSVLTDLLKSGMKFRWSEEAEKTFLDIKSRLTSRPIHPTLRFRSTWPLIRQILQLARYYFKPMMGSSIRFVISAISWISTRNNIQQLKKRLLDCC